MRLSFYVMQGNLYTKEEMKVTWETRKMLGVPDMWVRRTVNTQNSDNVVTATRIRAIETRCRTTLYKKKKINEESGKGSAVSLLDHNKCRLTAALRYDRFIR